MGVGNVLLAPFKAIFGQSCRGVCSVPWDVICFIEHLCVLDILRLLLILILCYIGLLFLYALVRIGLCQCITKSLCKMCWLSCKTCCFAIEDITSFLWHTLLSTKRVNRRRHRRRRLHDMEEGFSSGSEADFMTEDYNRNGERREERLRTRQVSVRGVSGRHRRLGRSERSLQLRNVRNLRTEGTVSKRRRIR